MRTRFTDNTLVVTFDEARLIVMLIDSHGIIRNADALCAQFGHHPVAHHHANAEIDLLALVDLLEPHMTEGIHAADFLKSVGVL